MCMHRIEWCPGDILCDIPWDIVLCTKTAFYQTHTHIYIYIYMYVYLHIYYIYIYVSVCRYGYSYR